MLGLGLGLNKLRSSGLSSILQGAMVWGRKSLYKWGDTSTDIWGFANPNDIDPESQVVYDRIISDGGVSNLIRLNYFVVGLKTIYGSLTNVPVCYDAHWIGYKLGSGTGATAGQAAAKLYSLTVAGDAVQTTAASQPLLLSHNGTDNYWWGSGVSNNFVSTPNASANQIRDDIDLIAYIDYKNNGAIQVIIDKTIIGSSNGYTFYINATNFIGSQFVSFENKSSTVSIGASYVGWVRCTRTSSTGDLRFFTSNDTLTTNPNSVTWTQLGTTVSGTNGTSANPNTPLLIGQYANATLVFGGKIYRATIANSIGGAPVVDFNPATYNASTSQTAWTSATGEVWTINIGTATSGYKGVLVDRTIVQGDGVDDVISVAISGNAIRTQYIAHKSLGVGTTQIGGLYSVSNQHAQAFYYNGNKYSFYQTGAFDGPFGAVVVGTTNRALRISGAVGGTGTNWIPFQNGVDVSNGGNNIGLLVSYSNLFLFARGGGSGFDNAIFNTYIMSSVADNLTIRTATQAFAKTLNNNI